MADSGWIAHTVWWQIYPLGFVGAARESGPPGTPVVHGLRKLIGWLDYAVRLGASGIAFGPIFASETHGYDTVDYFRIDPRLGDEDDFDALIAACRARGLRVLLDGVFNHVGRGFPAFRQVLDDGPAAASASWFRLSWPAGAFRPGIEPAYEDFEGHRQLVALNHDDAEVAAYVGQVMKYWLARGADGWRLDAAYAVPAHFWSTVQGRVRKEFPQAYFVGEFIHGDYVAAVHEGSLDSATQYELWKAIWSSLNDGNFYELASALERHNTFLSAYPPLTFVGNHDVTRIASRLNDSRFLPHALVILFTAGGTPSVYAGDEQGFRGIKEDRVGGDDAIRPEFPEHPDDLSPLGLEIFRLHQDLIGLRRRNPWLHRARTEPISVANEQLVYRLTDGTHALAVLLNLADRPLTAQIPGQPQIMAGRASLFTAGNTGSVVVPPQGWAVLDSSGAPA
ncbi:alpha-amylase family protein [Paenarthrobacter sp. Z7-10]|nr:alpha-amylase family protein [Paenarthrobacter sp. Z7-10]